MTSTPTRALSLRDVSGFDLESDVVVVGQGAAGGAAAIEAARAGADVLVLERMTRGGGATALSTGLTYFGGGTAIQRACGFEDTPADMIAEVTLAAGPRVEPERIRLYCERSVEHFEWFRALGVEYKATFVDDKLTHPITDDCLMFSGNELSWPDCEQARPVSARPQAGAHGRSGRLPDGGDPARDAGSRRPGRERLPRPAAGAGRRRPRGGRAGAFARARRSGSRRAAASCSRRAASSSTRPWSRSTRPICCSATTRRERPATTARGS